MSHVLLLLLGLGVLTYGAELLVRGASRLAAAAGVSTLVVGLTVVAFGTSAPEFAVSIGSALSGQTDLALGNVVGSNIFNVLCILGISALVTPLVVSAQLVRLDVPVMIGTAVLVGVLALDGAVGRVDSAVLFFLLLLYLGFLVRQGRRGGTVEPEGPAKEGPAKEGPAEEREGGRARVTVQVALVAAGLVLLVLGSRAFVSAAVTLASAFGVSELVIGLTIVAGGTSMPELATSVIASIRGQRDLAVGNVVGSNVFNLLGVLGLTGIVSLDGIPVSEGVLRLDLPVMVLVCFACLPIFVTGHRIDRWEGGLFLAYYVAYVGWLVLAAKGDPGLRSSAAVLAAIAVPLTLVTLAVIWWRESRAAT